MKLKVEEWCMNYVQPIIQQHSFPDYQSFTRLGRILWRCLSSLKCTDVYFCTALLRVHHSVSVQLRSGLWQDLFLLHTFAAVFCWASLVQDSAVKHMASHFLQKTLQSSWLTQWLRGAQNLGCKRAQIITPLLPYLYEPIWGVCVDILCGFH